MDVDEKGDSDTGSPFVFLQIKDEQVRNAGTGMAEEMTRRKQTATKKTGKGPLKKLNEAAFKIVEKEADAIARALMRETRKGHVMSARLLVELAERCGDVEQAEALQPFRALLLDLAAEPEWPADAAEAVKRARAGKTDS